MFTTNPDLLKQLLSDVADGKIQLPDFQRGWVWDDGRIKELLVSISRGFPIGAVMTLKAGGDVQFQTRPIEGVILNGSSQLQRYLLDGQQRLTSLYQALRHDGPVETRDRPGGQRTIRRWYYIDMQKMLDPESEPEDTIVSVPEDRVERRNFGREIVRDLSSQENEFKMHMMPTESVMEPMTWMLGYLDYWQSAEPERGAVGFFRTFQDRVLNEFAKYQIPAINLDEDTSKEAICTVFEKVNTGGVTLTVFELLTASLAADDFRLRDDWDARRRRLHSKYGVLQGVDSTNFLQAMTLLATQERRRQTEKGQSSPAIGCKRNDILSLTLDEYRRWADEVEAGFEAAARFMHTHFVFTRGDVPYNAQLVSLAALYAELGSELESADTRARLERWYWCGVFGEMYGSAVESQYARDFVEVPRYIREGIEPALVREANFAPTRLITLRTRQSAAYKGLYAMQMENGAADWSTGQSLTFAVWLQDSLDIHHIFPKRWCEREANPEVPSRLYNSIINKTPIDARTNRKIGGNAPSRYIRRLRELNSDLGSTLRTHWLSPDLLETDKFAECFIERGEAMLELIGRVMGRDLGSGREVFLQALQSAGLVAIPSQLPEPSGFQLGEEMVEDEEEYDHVGDHGVAGDMQYAADD